MLSKKELLQFNLESSIVSKGISAETYDFISVLNKINQTHQFVIDFPSFPQVAETIYREELIKAVGGTQSIEGNNFTAEEISAVFERSESGHSMEVAENEILNSKRAYEFIIEYVLENKDEPIDERVIKQLHTFLTRSLPYQYNSPGEYRTVPVRFGIPLMESILQTESEVKEAMKRFVAWLNADNLGIYEEYPLVKANLAHYYFTEIHPFGDGNGRTARAVEAMILFKSGAFNSYCFWSLANYFALHRDNYLKGLRAIRETKSVLPFLKFSASGYLYELERIKNRALTKVKKLMLMDYVQYLLRTKKSQEIKINNRIVAVMELICNRGKRPMKEYIDDPIFFGLYSKISTSKISTSTFKRDFKKMLQLNLITLSESAKGQDFLEPNYTLLEGLSYRS